MRKIINTLRMFSFWGLVFFLLFLIGFGITMNDFFSVLHDKWPIVAISLYLMISVIVFPICMINDLFFNRNKLPLIEEITITLPTLFWPVYKALDVREYVLVFRAKESISEKLYDIGLLIWQIVCFLIWWAMVIFGSIYLSKGTDIISVKIQALPLSRLLISVGVTIAVCLVLYLIGLLLEKRMNRIIQMEISAARKSSRHRGTRGQQYYDRHFNHMPSCCRACGGPYPDCKDSCKIFDD